MESTKQILRQYIKTLLQNTLLPLCYLWGKRRPVDKKLVLLADSNTFDIPESMTLIRRELIRRGYRVEEHFCDFSSAGMIASLKYMMRFMVRYARAKAVFVCNYFVPCTACKKRSETTVVQLWHSCGALKKFGYDAPDDISSHFKGSVTRNFDYYTVSSPYCVGVFESAFRLEKGKAVAIGISRTDQLFDKNFAEKCRTEFYEKYPEYKGKKLLLYAPTFRGNAGNAYSCGEDAILRLEKKLGDEWAILIKMHPRVKSRLTNCDISTNRLFPVVDMLISDYSSLIFEYSLFRKPMILWAPDLEEYTQKRDFYLDIKTDVPCPLITEERELYNAVINEIQNFNGEKYDSFINKYMSACDGNSTLRTADLLKRKGAEKD